MTYPKWLTSLAAFSLTKVVHILEHVDCCTLTGSCCRWPRCTSVAAQIYSQGIHGSDSCSAGITPRFGTDIFDRLKKEKTVQVKDPTVKTGPQGWTLTEEVKAAEVTSVHVMPCYLTLPNLLM